MALEPTDVTHGQGAVVRLLGGLLVTVAAVQFAVLECFYLPLRIASVPVPLSIPAAVLGNVALPALAYRLTRSRLAALLPVLAWTLVVVVAAVPRPEGDVIVTGTARGLAFLLLGLMACTYAVGRLLAMPARRNPARAVRDGVVAASDV